ncbi:O-antigen ligase family protein [Brevundimonas sp. TSRC1-1]|uniref:O-antigen ligase family protein n=1 Tax=Brevundimonas sp. TSRC1-1 TaxID=2804562 RepID=UPI003CE6A5C0
MTVPSPRRKRSNPGFAPSGTRPGGASRSRPTPWTTRAAVALVPTLLALAHLTFGANQPIAALWFSTLLVLALVVALAVPSVRLGLHDLAPLAPLALLFAATLGAAAWSFTAWAPGGAHPIWAWAGAPSGALTVNRPATLMEIAKLAGLACIFLVGALQSARYAWASATFQAVLAIGAVYGAISLLMFVSGAQLMAGERLSGGFLSPNSAGSVFGVLTVLGLGNLLRGSRQTAGLDTASRLGKVAVPLAYVLLSATCLLLTASRMGVAATALAAGVLLAWELFDARRQRLSLLLAGGVLVLTALILISGGNDLLWTRLGTVEADRLVRSDIFAAHWAAFLASPLFGYGLGSFIDINNQIMTAGNYDDLWAIRATHNVYLQWLEEAGLVGAAPMFGLLGLIMILSTIRSGTVKRGQTLLRALIVSSLVLLVHGATDFALQVPSIAAFWAFLLGCQYSFGRR